MQNHVGHFLWTNLLLERVLAAGGHARIVNVSSTGYLLSDVRLEDANWDVSRSTAVRKCLLTCELGWEELPSLVGVWQLQNCKCVVQHVSCFASEKQGH